MTTEVSNAVELLETARVVANDAPERARTLLREVIVIAEGSPTARDAMALMAELDGRLPATEPLRDEQSEHLRDRWLQLTGPGDGRLLPLLAEIGASTAMLRSLQPLVEEDLGRWIDAAAAELEHRAAAPLALTPAGFETVDALVREVSAVGRFEMVLRPSIERFHRASFACLLSQEAPRIELATASWRIDEARRLFESMTSPPAGFAERCFELQSRIDDAEHDRLDTERRLAALDGPQPTDWPELRALLASVAHATERLTAGGLPEDYEARLSQATNGGRRRAVLFLEQSAAQLDGLESMRRFWGELRELERELRQAGLDVDEGWLAAGIEALESRCRRRVRASSRLEALEATARELEIELATAPPPVQRRGKYWLSELDRSIHVWRATSRGERCEQVSGDWLPEALASASVEHRETLRRLDEGFRILEATPAAAPRALEIADQVLADRPDHGEARRLREAASTQQLKHDLDVALAAWNLDRFRELARHPATPESYHAWLEPEVGLETIAELAQSPVFADSETAAQWWRRLAKAFDGLPPRRSVAVDSALRELLLRRHDQWCVLLDEQLAQELPVARWRDLLHQLEGLAGHEALDLGGELVRYQAELRRRCQLASAEYQIVAGRYREAAEVLEAAAGDDWRKRRLSVRLAIEEPRAARRWSQLAEALHRWWGVATEIYKEAAGEMLEQALDSAWRAADRQALDLLRKVAQRARGHHVVQKHGPRLESWLDWLQLEDECRGGVPIRAAGLLFRHLDGLGEEERNERALVLVDGWRQRGLDVPLAWIFRALPESRARLFPDLVDPGSELEQRGRELAADIAAKLRVEDEPATEDLAELLRQLETLERQITRLEHLRRVLPRTTEDLLLPDELVDAGRQLRALAEVLEGLGCLLASDLRQEKSNLDALRHVTVQALRGLPLQRSLLARLDALQPLTRLRFQEAELRRAAERCGEGDLDREGVFAELAEKVREIDTELARAGLEHAPVARAILEQYRGEIAALAGDLRSPVDAADLDELAAHFESLQDGEETLRGAISALEREEPFFGAEVQLDAERHRAYLALVPQTPPTTRRTRRLFDRFTRIGQRRAVLGQGLRAGLLPAWVDTYLREGAH